MKLHLFNPGHDEALAAHAPAYTDTRAARQLSAELAELPRLWAAGEDAVVPFTPPLKGIDWTRIDEICPWGWNAALCRILAKAGAPPRLLPSPARLERIRQLSSRQHTAKLLTLMHAPACCLGAWLTSTAQATRFASEHRGAVFKKPWSSSGRGLSFVGEQLTEAELHRTGRIIAQQGGIEAEPIYQRIQDFALEFTADGTGEMRYDGLSVFVSSGAGRYGGNLIAPDAELLRLLPPLDAGKLAKLRETATSALETHIGASYRGPLGIDMMLFRSSDGEQHINPCVELNLRRTMGHAALAARERLCPREPMLLKILPTARLTSASCVVAGGKLLSAALVPLDVYPSALQTPTMKDLKDL